MGFHIKRDYGIISLEWSEFWFAFVEKKVFTEDWRKNNHHKIIGSRTDGLEVI